MLWPWPNLPFTLLMCEWTCSSVHFEAEDSFPSIFCTVNFLFLYQQRPRSAMLSLGGISQLAFPLPWLQLIRNWRHPQHQMTWNSSWRGAPDAPFAADPRVPPPSSLSEGLKATTTPLPQQQCGLCCGLGPHGYGVHQPAPTCSQKRPFALALDTPGT